LLLEPKSRVLRRGFLTIFSQAFLALQLACSDGSGSETARPHIASELCPLKTPAEWQRFIESTAEDESWVRTCSLDAKCDEGVTALLARVNDDVLATFDRCATDLVDNPRILRCTDRLRRFIPTWIRQHARGSYGFVQDNAAYLSAQIEPQMPSGMMVPPAALIAALPERASIEQAARVNGWPYLTHDGCLGGIRLFVTVRDPEDRFDQWMVIGLDPSATRVEDRSILSFIGVEKRDAHGKLAKVRLHFRDYIAFDSGGSYNLLLPEAHSGKCFGCHASGMRLLIPTHESRVESAPVYGEAAYGSGVPPDFGFQRLSEMNQKLLSYGVPDWNGSIDPADHGPALGEALGCTHCHNGVARGVLTVSTDEATLKRKIVDELGMRSFAVGKDVPDRAAILLLDREKTQNPPLSPDEQAALDRARAEHWADYQAFVAQRFPTWKAWVLSEACR
jgi:hypothetical protein